jgi:hypothetical protein
VSLFLVLLFVGLSLAFAVVKLIEGWQIVGRCLMDEDD